MLRLKIKEIELQNIRDKEASELFLKREIFSKEYLKFLGFIKKNKMRGKDIAFNSTQRRQDFIFKKSGGGLLYTMLHRI